MQSKDGSAAAPRFRTTDSGIAQFLIYKGYRGQSAIDPTDAEGVVQFTFIESPQLRADIDAHATGTVPVREYDEAGRIIRRLILGARYRHAEFLRRSQAGEDTRRVGHVRQIAREGGCDRR